MKSSKLFLLTFCLIGATVQAQVSLERFVVGSTGNYSTAGNVSVSATVGESVVETAISGSLILTQGFQQPNESDLTGLADALGFKLDYRIYPNPTTERLMVRIKSEKPLSLQLSLADVRGRATQVPAETVAVGSLEQEIELDLSQLADGVYLLSFRNERGEIIESFRVRKIH